MSKKIKAALIGCGMIADTHLTALLNAGADVIGVFDKRTDAAAAFASARGMRTYVSMEDLLSDDIEVVSVCTPSGTHAFLAEEIMEHDASAHRSPSFGSHLFTVRSKRRSRQENSGG